MTRRVYRTVLGALALSSLAACLALGILVFLGRVPDAAYKKAFLAASALWFVCSIARGKPVKGDAGGAGVV